MGKRTAHGATHVNPGRAGARRAQSLRLTWRTREAQSGHQPLGFGEFVGGVIGKVFAAQCFGGGKSQRHGRVVVRLTTAVAIFRIDGECQRFCSDGLRVITGREALPKHGECHVERFAVFGSAYEGRVRRPIHTIAVGDADGIETLHEGDHRVEWHAHACTTQHPPEGDCHAFGGHPCNVLRSKACLMSSATP